MHKNSITKKIAWSLILKLNSAKPCRKTLLNINENISGHDVDIIYNTKTNNVESKKYKLDDSVINLFKIFLPIVVSPKKIQFIAHIAQSLDGFIATDSGESRYISSQSNLEHIHRLRAVADVIIVGANTFIEDRPKLTTRLVDGSSPEIYLFDPKKIIKISDIPSGINVINSINNLKRDMIKIGKKIIYIEGGGKTISHFMNNKVLDRIHICLCPIILGGGRPSFIQEKYVRLNKLKSFDPNHYKMGEDVLFDIKF